MEWRTDPPPKKVNEFILGIFNPERPYPHVVFWAHDETSDDETDGVWVFADFDSVDDDPMYWMPITMPQQQRKP